MMNDFFIKTVSIMKKRNKLILPLCLMWMMAGFYSSCDDFMDVHQKYLEGGEIIYAPKPLLIGFEAGLNRVGFYCVLYKAPNVRTIEVSWMWNRETFTKEIVVTPNNELFLVTDVFPDMEEGAYTFTVKTVDIYGHYSVETTGFANVYDREMFTASTSNRYAGSISRHNGTEMTLNWADAPASVAWTDVVYTTLDGSKATAKMLPNETSVVLPDGMLTAPIEYRSAYLPEEGAIDTVYGEWLTTDAYPKQSLWLAGNGSSAEWDANKQIEIPFDESTPWVYTLEVALDSNGGELKILFEKGNWDGYNLRPLVASGSILETTMQLYAGGTDLKWKVVGGQDGTYKITVDLNQMKIYYEKL
jgi:hypothetical protein